MVHTYAGNSQGNCNAYVLVFGAQAAHAGTCSAIHTAADDN